MNRYITETYPETSMRITPSLGVNFTTNILLIDYCLNDLSRTSEWTERFSRKLPESVKRDLQQIRPVFAHGAILREFYIMKVKDPHQDWDSFINWWKNLSTKDITELISYGISENVTYYYENLFPIPEVEEVLGEGLMTEETDVNEENRHIALEAVIRSWSAENVPKQVRFFEEPKKVKETIIHLFEGIWRYGFNELWEANKEHLMALGAKPITNTYKKNDEAIHAITHLYPDTNDIPTINRAEEIIFIPTLNLGRFLSFYTLNQTLYVMYDLQENRVPVETEEKNEGITDVYSLFEGLGDKTRLQILALLSQKGELFAQQIVKSLNLNQSTVSRHLSHLQKTELISIRHEGNTKFYSLNKRNLKGAVDYLNGLLG